MAVVMVVLVVVMVSCNSEVWQVTVEVAMAVVVRMLARGSGGKGGKRWWPWR